jgi:hypothetical protein
MLGVDMQNKLKVPSLDTAYPAMIRTFVDADLDQAVTA